MTPEDPGPELAAMETLFNQAVETEVTMHAVDFLARARLLLDIGDLEDAKAVIHTAGGREAAAREWQDLSADDRKSLTRDVMDDWADVTTVAVKRLWHAAKVLGFKPDSIDPKHVALTAATYLGSQDQEPAAGDDVDKAA